MMEVVVHHGVSSIVATPSRDGTDSALVSVDLASVPGVLSSEGTLSEITMKASSLPVNTRT